MPPVSDDDALARSWGLLNRIREDAAAAYRAAPIPADRPAVVARLGVGGLLVAGSAALLVSLGAGGAPARGDRFLAALFVLVGLGLAAVGALVLHGAARRLRGRRAYHRRSRERARLRLVLDDLARTWGGAVSADGVAPAVRFLVERWPDAAPEILMVQKAPAGEREDRLTLSAEVLGRPLLVHVVDFVADDGAGVRPPVLVVLAACAIDPSPAPVAAEKGPFRGAAAPPPAGPERAWLSANGFSLGLSRGGAHAVHAGGVVDAPTLARAAESLVAVCLSAPPATSAPDAARAPERDPPEGHGEVVDAFLAALRDQDASRLLARAHFLLFADLETEPTPASLRQRLRAARGRPIAWDAFGVLPRPVETSGSGFVKEGTLDVELAAGTVTYGVPGEVVDRGRARMRVSLARAGERWCVSGYDVADDGGPGGILLPEPVLGIVPSCER